MADEDQTEETPEETETEETEVDSTESDDSGDSEETTEEVDDRDNQITALTSQLAQMESDHATALANLTAAKDAVIAELRSELLRSVRTHPNDSVSEDESYDSDKIPTFDDLVAKAIGQKEV